MPGTHKIYALDDPREPDDYRYVGWTINTLEQRLRAHLDEARRKPHTHRARWVNKVRREGFTPRIILLEIVDDYAEAEKRWIADFRAKGYRLTNGTDGGKGVLGARWKLNAAQIEALRNRPKRPVSAEERERLRQMGIGNKNWLGKKRSEESKTKQSRTRQERFAARPKPEPKPKPPRKHNPGHTGHQHSEETKQQFSAQRRGKARDPDASARAAETNRGKTRTDEQRERIRQGKLASWKRKKGGA